MIERAKWIQITRYYLIMVCNGVSRAFWRVLKIKRPVYGGHTKAASRTGAQQSASVTGMMIGLDPSGPAGGEAVAYPRQAGKRTEAERLYEQGLMRCPPNEDDLQQDVTRFRVPGCPLSATGEGCPAGTACGAAGQCAAARMLPPHWPGPISPTPMIDAWSAQQIMQEMITGVQRSMNEAAQSAADALGHIRRIASGLCPGCAHADHTDRADEPCGYGQEPGVPDGAMCGCTYPADMVAQARRMARSAEATPGAEPEPDTDDLDWDGDFSRATLAIDHPVVREGDPAYNDLQTYLEGGPVESIEAARRLDQRAVDNGQLSPGEYKRTWNELPRRTYDAHKIWCPRWPRHDFTECPVWGDE